tara:strand:+ start:490 stop:894 length:405 start_codon:yes stop_codon:yes gene_type:complete
MKLAWEKTKLWCFHNWRILIVSAALLVAFLLGRKNVRALKTQLQMSKELYKKEVDAINNAANKKTELQSAANVKYKRAMEIARQRAEESEDIVEEVQNERIKELIETNKENPEEIDRILSKEFGILIMEPKDKS